MVVEVPEHVVVLNKVIPPPPAGAAQVGTPPETVKTLPFEPMANLVFVFAVADLYSISPSVVEGFNALVVVSIEDPKVRIAAAPSFTKSIS